MKFLFIVLYSLTFLVCYAAATLIAATAAYHEFRGRHLEDL
jgi:hypothetical protein